MLQHSEEDDFVFTTGETNTVRKFVELIFAQLGIQLEWRGKAENEVSVVKSIDKDKIESLSAFRGQKKN